MRVCAHNFGDYQTSVDLCGWHWHVGKSTITTTTTTKKQSTKDQSDGRLSMQIQCSKSPQPRAARPNMQIYTIPHEILTSNMDMKVNERVSVYFINTNSDYESGVWLQPILPWVTPSQNSLYFDIFEETAWKTEIECCYHWNNKVWGELHHSIFSAHSLCMRCKI